VPLGVCIAVAYGMGEAMHYAHSVGMILADHKLCNVLLALKYGLDGTPVIQVKICDLGSSFHSLTVPRQIG
jgi:hypothetical protein